MSKKPDRTTRQLMKGNPKEVHKLVAEQDELLLTPEEIAVHKLYGTEGLAGYDIDGLLKAQLAKVKQRSEQKIEELFKEIELACKKCPDEPFGKLPASMFWQSLKDKYLRGEE